MINSHLILKNTCAGYGFGDIIKNINLTVNPGETLFVIGANGCGKTTLLRAVSGILEYSGSIELLGKEVRETTPKIRAQKMAYVMQSSSVFFPYTVEEYVSLGRYAASKSMFSGTTEYDKTAVLRALCSLELTEQADTPFDALSGGQQQRTILARAFAAEPEIILLDEPTNHLDLKYQIDTMEYLLKWRNGDRTVVAVMHDLNLVAAYADRVLLMKDGEVFALGTPEQILTAENLTQCFGMDIRSFMQKSLEHWNK